MNKKYDLAVYIGRFQPFHNGHKYVVEEAKKIADNVLILVGSSNTSISVKNPWTYDERREMIGASFDTFDIVNGIIVTDYLDDYTYEENQWITDVQNAVNQFPTKDGTSKICLIGHTKDESSYYLKNFPQWDLVDVEYHEVIDATRIRDFMFGGVHAYIKGAVPEKVYDYIINFMSTDKYFNLVDEYNFLLDYKNEWSGSPFPPTFNTVDAVVVQSGHVLLIKRGTMPGEGLWALPGGFINEEETLKDACIRELREETRLKVPEPVLRGSIVKEETFDYPGRSQRGRTITRAFLIQLDNSQELPKVKGSDDAKHAEWIEISEFYRMAEEMYEDHYHIICKLLDNM
jgi:bifunctional NMN adenylyltransferase/nudix hydrolase